MILPTCYVTFFRAPVICFVLFFSFFCSSFFFLPIFIFSGLSCCVLVSGTLALHLLYLDKLRLFGLLCLTQSVTTELVSLHDEESARALGVQ